MSDQDTLMWTRQALLDNHDGPSPGADEAAVSPSPGADVAVSPTWCQRHPLPLGREHCPSWCSDVSYAIGTRLGASDAAPAAPKWISLR